MRHVYDWGGSSGCRLGSVGGEGECAVEHCRIERRRPNVGRERYVGSLVFNLIGVRSLMITKKPPVPLCTHY